MKLKKALKLALGVLVAFPLSFFMGNELLANYLTDSLGNELYSETLISCGGGGGGSSPAAKAAKKLKQAKTKLNFKKRQLSKMAAAGESTTQLEAEIAELEALISEQKEINFIKFQK